MYRDLGEYSIASQYIRNHKHQITTHRQYDETWKNVISADNTFGITSMKLQLCGDLEDHSAEPGPAEYVFTEV